MEILYDSIAAFVVGIISIFIGEMIPREKVREDLFPFRPYKWEENGGVYEKLRVKAWKAAVPDLSRLFPWMVTKSVRGTNGSMAMDRLVKESCVAELVHAGLIIVMVPVILLIGGPYRFILALLYAAGNLVFIVIQRYNRPRFIKLREKMRRREAKVRTA